MDWIINTKVREIVSNKKKTIFHSVLSQEFLVLHFNKNTPYELWIDSFNNKYFRAFLIFIENGLYNIKFGNTRDDAVIPDIPLFTNLLYAALAEFLVSF